MQNQGVFTKDFCFWVYFTDLPKAGLKKAYKKQLIRKKWHSTVPLIS